MVRYCCDDYKDNAYLIAKIQLHLYHCKLAWYSIAFSFCDAATAQHVLDQFAPLMEVSSSNPM